ncbi:hypothetical protein MHBO_002827, partial [Bonamia ostreae]
LKTRTFAIESQIKKYDFLHENSEGFSRLIIESSNFEFEKFDQFEKSVWKIIGKYDLSLERALDLLTDFANFYVQNQNLNFLNIFSKFPKQTLCKVFGLKIMNFEGAVPKSFFRLCAYCLKLQIFDISDFYNYIPGDDNEIDEMFFGYEEKSKIEIENVKLEPIPIEGKEKVVTNLPRRRSYPPYSSCPRGHYQNMEFAKITENTKICDICNNSKEQILTCPRCKYQNFNICKKCCLNDAKFSLVNEMLEIGEDCYRLIEKIGMNKIYDHPATKKLIGRKIENIIEESNLKNWDSFLKAFEEIIKILPDQILLFRKRVFSKLCKFLERFLSKKQTNLLFQTDSDHSNNLTKLIKFAIFPTLNAMESNFVYSEKVWAFLSQLNYEKRFEIYGWWLNEGHKRCHKTAFNAKVALLQTMRFRKMHLHKDEKKVGSGKALLKFVHGNSVLVINDLLCNIMHRVF